MNKKEFLTSLQKTIEEALKRSKYSARSISWRVAGHDNVIKDLRAGHIPNSDRLYDLCRELGLDFYVGPPIRVADFNAIPTLGFIEDDGRVLIKNLQQLLSQDLHSRGCFVMRGKGFVPVYFMKDRIYCSLKVHEPADIMSFQGHHCIVHTTQGIYQLGIMRHQYANKCVIESIAPGHANMVDIGVRWFLLVTNVSRHIQPLSKNNDK